MEFGRKTLLRVARPLHVAPRGQKVRAFHELIGPNGGGKLLDVGGGTGVDGEFIRLYRQFEHVAVLNLDPGGWTWNSELNLTKIRADGCNLPFANTSIDWIFSNAVIEHVGNWTKQQQFAAEIRRVAKLGYFVATPSKFFPIEPHTMLPFYQFLSKAWQQRALRLSPGYLREWEEINLLSAKQLRALFPEARIVRAGLPIFANSLIAIYRNPAP